MPPLTSGACSPGTIRAPPLTPRGRRRTRCTPPPRRWAAGFSGRPPTPTTARHGHRTGASPRPPRPGTGLRRAARLLSAYGYITSDPSFRPLVLIIRLAVLAEAVADLRQSQQHAAQAAGALRAAQQLHAARGIYAAPGAAGQRPARSAATLAGAGFPAQSGTAPAMPPAPEPPPRPRPPSPPGPGQQPRRQ